MKTIFIIFTFAFCFFATSDSVFGQTCPKYPCVIDSVDSGEVASAGIDNFLYHSLESGERIFVIAHLGKEKSDSGRNLNRLCEVRNYFLDLLSNKQIKEYFNLFPVIFAEGAGVEGEGKIEFYLGSKLHLTRHIKRNRTANLDCCGELTQSEVKQKNKECRDWKKKGVTNK
jgi:hypothetical protein